MRGHGGLQSKKRTSANAPGRQASGCSRCAVSRAMAQGLRASLERLRGSRQREKAEDLLLAFALRVEHEETGRPVVQLDVDGDQVPIAKLKRHTRLVRLA